MIWLRLSQDYQKAVQQMSRAEAAGLYTDCVSSSIKKKKNGDNEKYLMKEDCGDLNKRMHLKVSDTYMVVAV